MCIAIALEIMCFCIGNPGLSASGSSSGEEVGGVMMVSRAEVEREGRIGQSELLSV